MAPKKRMQNIIRLEHVQYTYTYTQNDVGDETRIIFVENVQLEINKNLSFSNVTCNKHEIYVFSCTENNYDVN